MAAASLKLATIFSLTIVTLLLALGAQISALSTDLAPIFEDTDQDDEVYVLDNPAPSFRSRSRFLASIIKKGTHCDPDHRSICNGVSANNGTSLLYCCKTHCRNVLSDRNNCGRCGNKCKYGELCCQGTCTYVANNVNHCGKCNKKCPSGLKCDFGTCGYA
ncbi:hypothetical protein ACOSQ3_031341 [Xanthoceras sorbifolium]